jgi:hypothetical protein
LLPCRIAAAIWGPCRGLYIEDGGP